MTLLEIVKLPEAFLKFLMRSFVFYFQELQYPSIRAAINSHNLHSSSSIKSLLVCVFNVIYEHHYNLVWNSPQVNLVNFAENADIITAEILRNRLPYNRTDSFVKVLENLIEKQFESEMESSMPKETEAATDAKPQKMSKEVKKIIKAYSRLMKRPDKHPDYLSHWRQFYLKYSQHLATAGVVDVKYYNYIYDFREHFKKYLEMKKQSEVSQQQEIDAAQEMHQQILEAINEENENENDFELKIIEKPVETVEVSSDEDDDDDGEPHAKKAKVIILSINNFSDFKRILIFFRLKRKATHFLLRE